MKTRLHHYWFPSASHPGYAAELAKIKANAEGRGQWMHCISSQKDRVNNCKADSRNNVVTEDIEIEAKHLFSNQSNTTDGRRVFDHWEEYFCHGQTCKVGHWMEITPEIAKARVETHNCGWCGNHYGPCHDPLPADGMCDKCLDGPHLTEDKLFMLRLLPVSAGYVERQPLTDEELAAIMPRYVERQTTGKDSREAKARAAQLVAIVKEYKEKTEAAKTKHDGMLWLWERNINLDNVIYYSHTDKFSFGWREPVSDAVRDRLLQIMSEFPFGYEIKCKDGSKLEAMA
jgi:hypothetical protein